MGKMRNVVRHGCGTSAARLSSNQRIPLMWLVPPARLELARLAAADFESATSTDFVTRAAAGSLSHPAGGRAVLADNAGEGVHMAKAAAAKPYKTLEDVIGATPLVKLQRLPGAPNERRGNVILGKLEGNNPAGSVKDRPAISMIRRAEERGDIKPGDTLIEATSGNTGIALAMAAAIRGYRMLLIMPEDLSIERAQSMKAFGAELILTPRSGGMEHARDLAEQMQKDGKGRVLDQFANADNPRVHYETTGPEVWDDTGGRVTHFVSAMGTTGTITGVSRFLKEKNPAVRIVGAQPSEGSRIPGIRKWPEAYLPKIYEPSCVDELVLVSQADAEDMARRLAREEGLFAGISAAGACWVALQIAQNVENATIVFVVCDRGDRYLSTGVFPA
jgi:cysteine synthase B